MRFAVIAMFLAPLQAANCRAVDREAITAEDLAAHTPAFGGLNPTTLIGPSPLPGAIRTFSSGELAAIAKANGVVLDAAVPGVCFERAAGRLSEGQIIDAMRLAFAGRNVVIQIADYLRAALPSGTLEFPESGLSASNGAPDSPVLWRGSLRYAPGRTVPVWALVRIYQDYAAVVAAREIPSGTHIAEDDVKVMRRSLSPFTQHFGSIDAVVGRVAKKKIAFDTPLTGSLLDTPLDVMAGDTLLVVAANGQARIKFHAVARSQGRKGDRIVLLNPESNRTFRAIVDGNGQAHVGAAE